MLNGGNGAVRQRINFSKIPTVIKIPNLIEVQRRSYERFLQMNLLPSEREDAGLQAVFNSVFPITDFRGIAQLDSSTIRSATGNASAAASRDFTTYAAPAGIAAIRSSPIPSKWETCSARVAEHSIRTW